MTYSLHPSAAHLALARLKADYIVALISDGCEPETARWAWWKMETENYAVLTRHAAALVALEVEAPEGELVVSYN